MSLCQDVLFIWIHLLCSGWEDNHPPKSGILFSILLVRNYLVECAAIDMRISGTCLDVYFCSTSRLPLERGSKGVILFWLWTQNHFSQNFFSDWNQMWYEARMNCIGMGRTMRPCQIVIPINICPLYRSFRTINPHLIFSSKPICQNQPSKCTEIDMSASVACLTV